MQLKQLEIMKAYIIYDEETHENQLIITDINHDAIILQKASNCPDLCILRMSKDVSVNVVGQISDFNIVDVQYNKFFGEKE